MNSLPEKKRTLFSRALLFPTVAGVFLLIDQWRTGSPDSPLLPIFCVLIMVWTALFLDLWKRHNSQITFKWGVDGIEDDDIMRDSAAKVGAVDEDTKYSRYSRH